MVRSLAVAMTFSLLSVGASAQERRPHLSPEELVSLTPTPNIRPTFDDSGQYQSGGIGVLVYDGVNAMDAIGPYQVFASAGLQPILISASRDAEGKYKKTITTNSALQLTAQKTIEEVSSLEVLVVTGGARETAELAADTEVVDWVRSIHEHTVWTTSVCTGYWVLGAAGLLKDKRATGNWFRAEELLAHFGAKPTLRRYVIDGNVGTAAGVTAGIDLALALVQEVFRHDLNRGHDFTQAVMLDLEYDPDPPVRGGSVEKTAPFVVDTMQSMYDGLGLRDLVLSLPVP